MTSLDALILGITEGVTEFLPISSTGHLILVMKALGIVPSTFSTSFEITIQLGAILAAVVLYFRTIITRPNIIITVIAAFLPTAIIGLLVHGIAKEYLLSNATVVVWALGIGGIVLIGFEAMMKGKNPSILSLDAITPTQAIIIGIAQSVAIIPGVSRAAATIVGGMLLGIERRTIVDFSFLLAIPTMAAATGLDLVKSIDTFTRADFSALAIGFIVSFITAFIAMKWLLSFIKHHTFVPFGIYRVIVTVLLYLFAIVF
jgi:undecaprenyl-diphosphatase